VASLHEAEFDQFGDVGFVFTANSFAEIVAKRLLGPTRSEQRVAKDLALRFGCGDMASRFLAHTAISGADFSGP
jgi:hypothetical protein